MQRLVQAFRNVVLNAIKFTPDGGRIEITASLQPSENNDGRDHILVAIADTGVGIDKENLELVFEKFFRAYDPGLHSTGTYKFMGAGPGLGLTIAKGVIEGHGGRIWAESPGHNMESYPGTTFYVLLPVSPPADARRVMAFEAAAEKV
jgi:signal transduction histidine kinase